MQIKRLVKVINKKEMIKSKDGKSEFPKTYYYLELDGGIKLYCDFFGDDSRVLARKICEKEYID